MKNVTLHIETYDGAKTVTLEDETSFGRTDAAKIVLGDSGLSRLNTSFFRDEDAIFVVDENSTNGTFVDVGANIGYISYRIAKARPIAKNIIAVAKNATNGRSQFLKSLET